MRFYFEHGMIQYKHFQKYISKFTLFESIFEAFLTLTFRIKSQSNRL